MDKIQTLNAEIDRLRDENRALEERLAQIGLAVASLNAKLNEYTELRRDIVESYEYTISQLQAGVPRDKIKYSLGGK